MVTDDTFDFIYRRLLDLVGAEVPNKELADRFRIKLDEYRGAICKSYEDSKDRIKSSCMEDPTAPIDRHKCAAAFMIAVLKELPIVENNLNKERMAIFLGTHILKLFIMLESAGKNDSTLIDFISKNKGFKYPQCTCDEEPYKENWALGMNYDRKNGTLSVLALSNELFLLEKYNRMAAKIETLTQE